MSYEEIKARHDAFEKLGGYYQPSHQDRGELLDMLEQIAEFAEEQGAYLTAEGILAILEDKT